MKIGLFLGQLGQNQQNCYVGEFIFFNYPCSRCLLTGTRKLDHDAFLAYLLI